MTEINFNLPVQTLTGKCVIIHTTNGPDEKWPIVGSVEGSKIIHLWDISGNIKSKRDGYNLIQAPEFEPYSITLTEGEKGRGKVVGDVYVDPVSQTVKVSLMGRWKMEWDKTVSTTLNKNTLNQNSEIKKQINQEAPGGLATAFYQNLLKGGLDD